MKKIIIIIILLFLIFGTNNYQELNSLAIITNIGITKNKNNYEVTFQELIPKKEENKVTNKYVYYTNKSSNLKTALNKINDDITKKIYLSYLENIIINSNDSKILINLQDYFQNDQDNFNIIYTDNNPKEIIKYSSNYKYPNKIIKNNISFRTIKKNKLEKKKIKIPIIKLRNKKLLFYKYKEFSI